MLKPVGIESTNQFVILLAVILLVAVTPLGSEATQPLVFFGYRTLLFIIVILSLREIHEKHEWTVSPIFAALAGIALTVMWLSIVLNPGSYFEGMYRWYQHLLFGVAFIALGVLNWNQGMRWKQFILGSVILIDVVYLAIDIVSGLRPVIGPFANPNYFASFLLVGFAASMALVFFQKVRLLQFAGTAIAVLLFYGMTQAFSRGATIAAIAIAAVAAMRIGRKYTIVAVGLCLAVTVAASPYLLQKFLDAGDRDPYNYMRPQIWMGAVKLIEEHPILGVGLNQFDDASKKFAPPVEGQIGRFMKRPGIAHSEYLQYAAEIGLPGMLLLFATAGYLVFLGIRRAQTCPAELRVFQEASILTAVGLGTHALVDNNWNVPVMAAGLVVFSLGDVLPRRIPGTDSELPAVWKFGVCPRNSSMRAAAIMAVLAIYAHSTVIPAAGLYFNEAGHQAYLAKDLASAESLHRLGAGILPGCSICQDNVGIIYLDQYSANRERHLIDRAETFFSRAMKAHSTAQEPQRHQEAGLIQRLTGNIESDREIHLKIIDLDREILKSDPFNPFIRKNMAEALYNAGFREEGERELQTAIEVEPNYVPAYLRIADWLEGAGNTAESQAYRDKAATVVAKYESMTLVEPYEALLLGRSQPGS